MKSISLRGQNRCAICNKFKKFEELEYREEHHGILGYTGTDCWHECQDCITVLQKKLKPFPLPINKPIHIQPQ